MANLNPPFANSADKRMPTSDEREQGFSCGPADQQLFNGMFHRLEAEIGAVIDHAGIAQTDDRHTLLREAIDALISAATGGNPAGYILMSQAQARLPIFPEILSADGRLNLSSPSVGTVRIPGGVTILHRGIFPVDTVQEDLATIASRIYHVRWNPTTGFTLVNTGDIAYNPGSLAEDNVAFDSTYDDMLVARVITNASNVATITNLVNKNKILQEITNAGAMTETPNLNGAKRTATLTWDLARRPIVAVHPISIGTGPTSTSGGFRGSDSHDHDFHISRTAISRYGATYSLMRDYASAMTIQCTVTA